MKRKTNLFYTVGSDSNFITFSNYTESLTGSFLSTKTKLFPSAFLCLYAPLLENGESERAAFIKYLTQYYENKLAFIRDNSIENNVNVEQRAFPGDWLIYSIFEYFKNKQGVSINYAGQVTEQNYNGIFTDTIMVIDSNVCNSVDVSFKESTDVSKYIKYDDSTTYLYNWYITDASGNETSICPDYAESLNPLFDESNNGANYYLADKTIESINVYSSNYIDFIKIVSDDFKYNSFWVSGNAKCSTSESNDQQYPIYRSLSDALENKPIDGWTISNISIDKEDSNKITFNTFENSVLVQESVVGTRIYNKDEVKFNMVIPMYDMTSLDSSGKPYSINEAENLGLNDMNYTNKVPLGIWFSGIKPVILDRKNTTYAPSWALSLSSQFKPFPYSKSEVTEIDQTDTEAAFMTYAQIIVKHNEIINKMNDINKNILAMNNRINSLESKINRIGTQSSIDDLKIEIAKIKTALSLD